MPSRLFTRPLLLALATALVASCIVSAALAIPPGGPEPRSNGAKIWLDRSTVRAGNKVFVKGWNWKAKGSRVQKGAWVTIKLDDLDILAMFRIREKKFRGWVTIPRPVSPGKHWLRFLAAEPPTSIKSGKITVLRPRR